MDGFVTALGGQVTATNLWAQITPAATLIGVAILFALGYLVVRRVSKGLGHGKVRL